MTGALLLFAQALTLGLAFAWRQTGNETVMVDGMTIEATNRSGRLSIVAGEGNWRTFSWEGGKERVRLKRRTRRWYGSMGLYFPGGGKGVHLVVDEGQQHFCSQDEALEWLQWQKERMDWVYSSSGLVVGWYKTLQPDSSPPYWAVVVEVWQLCIKGRRPASLPGARDAQITVKSPQQHDVKACDAGSFVPSEPAVFSGRKYAGKALDYMRELGLSPEDVERVIAEGEILATDSEKAGWDTYWTHNRKGTRFVVLDSGGRVVRVQK